MRVTTLIAIGLAALITASGAGAAPRAGHKVDYSFFGQLTAVPANGQLPVTVQRGNHAALRAMLGQSVDQTFAYGNNTEFLKWSHGVPTVVQPGDLAAGDFVWLHIRDTAGSSLADLEQNPPAWSVTTAPRATRPANRSTCSAAPSPPPEPTASRSPSTAATAKRPTS